MQHNKHVAVVADVHLAVEELAEARGLRGVGAVVQLVEVADVAGAIDERRRARLHAAALPVAHVLRDLAAHRNGIDHVGEDAQRGGIGADLEQVVDVLFHLWYESPMICLYVSFVAPLKLNQMPSRPE